MFFEVNTFAGTGIEGTDDGPVTTATFTRPFFVAVSPSGIVYVAEGENGIRKIEGGVVSTLTSRTIGNVDGPLSTALFSAPSGIVSDQAGNLYIADENNHRIRKIDTSGNVTTAAGPDGRERLRGWVDDFLNEALFNRPAAIAIDATDANIYVSEHNRIRSFPLRFQPGRGTMEVRTVAAVGIKGFADGPAPVAQFDGAVGLAVTHTSDLFVADAGNCRIRRVTPSGMVTTLEAQFADERPALQARFEGPRGLAVDQKTGMVWVGDGTHVRMYSPLTNTVSTACSDRTRHQEPIKFENAKGVAISEGKIFVVDSNKIMLLTPHEDLPF
jgi:DNA-binding beta-propeller fold protein YncE